MAASEELYKATRRTAQPNRGKAQANAGDNVQDADFEEVK